MKEKTKVRLATGFLITGLSLSCVEFFVEHADIYFSRHTDDLFCKQKNEQYAGNFYVSESRLSDLENTLKYAPETVGNYQNDSEQFSNSVFGYIKHYQNPKLERMAIQLMDAINSNPNFTLQDKEAYALTIPMHLDAYQLDETYDLESVGRYLKKQPREYKYALEELQQRYPNMDADTLKKQAMKQTQKHAVASCAQKEDACGRKSILPWLQRGITDIKTEEYCSEDPIIEQTSSQAAIMTKMLYEIIDTKTVEKARRYHDVSILKKKLCQLIPKEDLADQCIQFFDRKQELSMDEFQDFYQNYIGLYYHHKYGTEVQASPIMMAYYDQITHAPMDAYPLVFKNYFAEQTKVPSVDFVHRLYSVPVAFEDGVSYSLTKEEYNVGKDAYEHILVGDATEEQKQLAEIWDLNGLEVGTHVIHKTTDIYGSQTIPPLSKLKEETTKIKTMSHFKK